MTNQVVGSLAHTAKQNGAALATTFLSCDVIVLCDTSGSMGSCDSHEGRSRYDQACIELAKLQGDLPGKIGVISFSSTTMFCPDGVPFNLRGGTDLAGALKFAKIADIPGAMRFVVISDGQPDDEAAALQVAANYHNRIDTIFVGPENGLGRDFLKRLAKASGGQTMTAEAAKQLADSVQKLLAA